MKLNTACVAVLAVLALATFSPILRAEPNRNNRDPEPDVLPSHTETRSQDAMTREFTVPTLHPTQFCVTGVLRYDHTLGAGAAANFANYDDLWSSGFGASLELSYDLLDGSKVHFGPYGTLGLDTFNGSRHTGADAAVGIVDVEPDALTIYSGMLGLKLQSTNDGESNLFWSAQIAGGRCHYDDVDADLTFRRSGLQFTNVNFYDQTGTWAFEAAARVGWANRRWAFFVGAGVRVFGPPNSGQFLQPGTGALSFVPIDFGMEYKW